MGRGGLVSWGRKGTGSQHSGIRTQPLGVGAGWLTRTAAPYLTAPSPPSWFQVKVTLGRGLGFFVLLSKIKMGGGRYTGCKNGYSVLDSWNPLGSVQEFWV